MVDINDIRPGKKYSCRVCETYFDGELNSKNEFCSTECRKVFLARQSEMKLEAIEIAFELVPDEWTRLFQVCEKVRSEIWKQQGREMERSSIRKYIDVLVSNERIEKRVPYKGKSEIRRTNKGSTV
jgi:hypothetical protein